MEKCVHVWRFSSFGRQRFAPGWDPITLMKTKIFPPEIMNKPDNLIIQRCSMCHAHRSADISINTKCVFNKILHAVDDPKNVTRISRGWHIGKYNISYDYDFNKKEAIYILLPRYTLELEVSEIKYDNCNALHRLRNYETGLWNGSILEVQPFIQIVLHDLNILLADIDAIVLEYVAKYKFIPIGGRDINITWTIYYPL